MSNPTAFENLNEVQEILRCWVKEHRGEPIPERLQKMLREAQTHYEAARMMGQVKARDDEAHNAT